MATKPAKPEPEADAQAEAPAPQAATPIWPTPTREENDAIAAAQAAGEPLPPLPWHHIWDDSPVDPQSYDPTVGAPT